MAQVVTKLPLVVTPVNTRHQNLTSTPAQPSQSCAHFIICGIFVSAAFVFQYFRYSASLQDKDVRILQLEQDIENLQKVNKTALTGLILSEKNDHHDSFQVLDKSQTTVEPEPDENAQLLKNIALLEADLEKISSQREEAMTENLKLVVNLEGVKKLSSGYTVENLCAFYKSLKSLLEQIEHLQESLQTKNQTVDGSALSKQLEAYIFSLENPAYDQEYDESPLINKYELDHQCLLYIRSVVELIN